MIPIIPEKYRNSPAQEVLPDIRKLQSMMESWAAAGFPKPKYPWYAKIFFFLGIW